jgi:hypothetical protein
MTTSRTSPDHQLILFKGAFYQLSPLTITLSILIICHNIIIFMDYFKDRAKFVPSLFMAIALSDILNAQAQLVLSVLSILVFNGIVSDGILYRSLYYYMATGLPGYTCSRVFNVALSLTLTVHLVDPFRPINNSRLKKITLAISVIFTYLHLLDMVAFGVYDFENYLQYFGSTPFAHLALWFYLPGFVSGATVYCAPTHKSPESSKCYGRRFNDEFSSGFMGLLSMLNFIVPPFLMLVCMLIQVVYLRRGISEGPSPLTSASHHASITIVMVSLLYFVSHITFLIMVIVWWIVGFLNLDMDEIPSLIHQGNAAGFTEFTLPLIFAALYPIILITRKPDLRQRYNTLYTRIMSCC